MQLESKTWNKLYLKRNTSIFDRLANFLENTETQYNTIAEFDQATRDGHVVFLGLVPRNSEQHQTVCQKIKNYILDIDFKTFDDLNHKEVEADAPEQHFEAFVDTHDIYVINNQLYVAKI